MLVERFVELADQLRIHGVEPLGPVERDQGDALLGLVDKHCGHEPAPLRGGGPSFPICGSIAANRAGAAAGGAWDASIVLVLN